MFSSIFGRAFGGSNNRQQQQQQPPPPQQQQQHPPPRAPPVPPSASRHFRDNLPLARVTADDLILDLNNEECIICFEDHSIGDIACKLPCGHLFHPECLKDWLEKQASCPICRYELETDDVEFEMQRKKRMRERKVRFRKEELMGKSIKELRELLALYSLGTQWCVDKRDMVDRLISSGQVQIIEGVPTLDMTRDELEAMSIGEIKRMLLDFGLTDTVQYRNALEKRELIECLVDSSRINLVAEKTSEADVQKEDTEDYGTGAKSGNTSFSGGDGASGSGKSEKREQKEDDKSSSEGIKSSTHNGNDDTSTSYSCERSCNDKFSIHLSSRSSTSSSSSSSSSSSNGGDTGPCVDFSSWGMKDLLGTARALDINLEGCLERADVVRAIHQHPDFNSQR